MIVIASDLVLIAESDMKLLIFFPLTKKKTTFLEIPLKLFPSAPNI